MMTVFFQELDYVGISNTVAEEGRAFVQRWSQNFTATEVRAGALGRCCVNQFVCRGCRGSDGCS